MLDHDIKTLIKILEESNIDELEVSTLWGRQKIRLRKNATIVPQNIDVPNNTLNQIPVDENITKPQSLTTEPITLPIDNPNEVVAEKETDIPTKNTITIKSPLVGTFYTSPNPDAVHFISVGDDIKEGQIICIIEAMKIFNEIESEYSGKILKILVEDGTPVEYEQDLLLISI